MEEKSYKANNDSYVIAKCKELQEHIPFGIKLNGKKLKDGRTSFSLGAKSVKLLSEFEELGYSIEFTYYKSEDEEKTWTKMSTSKKYSYNNYQMVPTKGTYGTKYFYTATVKVRDLDDKIVATIPSEDVYSGWAVWRKK